MENAPGFGAFSILGEGKQKSILISDKIKANKKKDLVEIGVIGRGCDEFTFHGHYTDPEGKTHGEMA